MTQHPGHQPPVDRATLAEGRKRRVPHPRASDVPDSDPVAVDDPVAPVTPEAEADDSLPDRYEAI